jgi:hypothetical protein
VVVVALLTWLTSTPVSFADAARREALRRQLTPKPTRQLTNLNLPPGAIITEATLAAAEAERAAASTASDAAATDATKPATPATPDGTHDEQWWRDRTTAARNKLQDDQNLVVALQSRISALTADFTSRDDPAQRAQVADDRQKAVDQLARLQKQIDQDQKDIAALQDDARKQGVPPAWVR